MNVISFIEKKRCEICMGNKRALEGSVNVISPFQGLFTLLYRIKDLLVLFYLCNAYLPST